MKKYILFFCVSLILLSPALAVGNLGSALGNLGQAGSAAGTTEGDVSTIAGTAINVALSLVGLIFLVLMVYAGYLWMTARGEEGQVDKAKKIISAAIIGMVIVLGAYAITQLVTTRFGSA